VGGVHSNLEWRYVRHVERPHGLPKAERQSELTGGSRSAYHDNRYAEFRVIVELDGKAWHLAERRWTDIHRDNFAARSGSSAN
jgi:very-short-patch-repair endonuclease